eukprot:424460_1
MSRSSIALIKNDASKLIPYLCVLGGFMTEFSIGSLQYTFGNLLPYIASYLASKDKNTKQNYDRYIDLGTWIYVARAITFVIGNILAAKLAQKIGGRLSILVGDLIISGSIIITYFSCSTLTGMIITYGSLSGIGCGISYILPLSIAIKWFPKNQTLIAGIILSGYGLSAVIFNVVITKVINPQNVSLDSQSGFLEQHKVLENIPNSFWKIGLIYFAMQLIALCLIHEKPNEIQYDEELFEKNGGNVMIYKELNDGIINKQVSEIHMSILSNNIDDNNISNWEDVLDAPDENKCLDFMEKYDLMILKEGIFWNLWFTTFFSQMTLIYYSSQWKTFTNQHLKIEDDAILSYMGSFSSIANASGRIFWGFIRDKSDSYRKTMGIMTLIDCFLLATWPLLGFIFGSGILLTIMATVQLGGIFFCQIGIYNVMVQRLSELYGVDKVNYYHGLLTTNQIPAAIFAALVVSSMRQTLGWIAMSIIMALFQFIAFVIVISSKLLENE